MVRASLLLLAFCSWAAELPAPPTSPAQIGAPAALPLPVTEELLARWDIPVERYLALSAPEKDGLRGELSVNERLRLRRLELIARLRPSDWRDFVTAKGFLTPEGLELVAEGESSPVRGIAPPAAGFEREDGRDISAEVFDGAPGPRPTGSSAGGELELDARVRNGTVASFTLTDPNKKLSFEAGQIGIDGRTPLIAPSPYLNIVKSWESGPDSWLDYRAKAQIGYVEMRARFFADGTGSGAAQLLGAAESLGLDADTASGLREQLAYNDGEQTQGLIVSSLLAQVSRAYNLYGPVDIAAAATSLTKMMHLVPNQAFDQSLGLRARLPGDELFAGLFGGVTENLSPFGNRLYQDMLSERATNGFNQENVPHWTTALWGRLPGSDASDFSISVGRRYNRDTTVSQVELSLMTDVAQTPLALRVKESREQGNEIAFDRHKQSLQLEAQLTPGLRGFVTGEREDFLYGNAEVGSKALYAGITIDLDGRRRGNGRAGVTVEQKVASEYGERPLAKSSPEFIRETAETVAGGLEAADLAAQLAQLLDSGAEDGRVEAVVGALSSALARLPPGASDALSAQLGSLSLTDNQRLLLAGLLGQAGGAGERAEFLARLRADVREAESLLTILTDADNWNGAVVSAGRAALLRELSRDRVISIPLLDESITFQTHAPVIIAAAGALNSRPSPLAPVDSSDIEPWLLRLAGKELGLDSGGVTPEQVSARLIERGQRRFQREVDQRLTPVVTRLLASSAYDSAGAAAAILGALPPVAADALRGRFGADLQGLLPASGASDEEVLRCLRNLTSQINGLLERELSEPLARAVAEMVSWSAEIISHEINLMTIHWIVASEELDRLTVDRGRKASELGTDMLISSFGRLDGRRRAQIASRLRDVRASAASRVEEDQAAFVKKMTALGRERLSALQSGPSWPEGLRVAVQDSSWAPLMAAYGDAAFFDMLGRLAKKRRASGKTEPLEVSFEFRNPSPTGGVDVARSAGGRRSVTLPPPGNSRRAAFLLSHLEDLLD